MSDPDAGSAAESSSSQRGPLRRFGPLAVLVAGLIAFFAFGLHDYISLEALNRHKETLQGWVRDYALLTGLAFMVAYAVMTAFSVPGGAVMTIAGGFLFSLWLATLLVVTGATLGATAVFWAARTAFRETLEKRAGPFIKKLEAGFREDARSYMFVLRLVPIFPFWLVNLVPAFLGVKTRTYVLATFFGIMPGSFVYASVGNGVGRILEAGGRPDLGIIFAPEILTPIIGLAALALIPVVYKQIKRRRGEALPGADG